ncbi:MAG: histidine phosphatase family protein [Puniceicoccales bacterium]|jgi:phosphohistidine phosphatase|nr:histidine phosphatase family protein [Puniceicoccales bacterium]
MHLFLLRHADATPTIPDELRTLTPLGRRQIRDIASKIDASTFARVGAIEHSPLVRARESAELFQLAAGLKLPLRECAHVTPDDDPRYTAQQVLYSGGDRFLIGHNPHFEKLAGLLLGQGQENFFLPVAFGLAACMALECFSPPTRSVPLGYWQLRWFIVPRSDD